MSESEECWEFPWKFPLEIVEKFSWAGEKIALKRTRRIPLVINVYSSADNVEYLSSSSRVLFSFSGSMALEIFLNVKNNTLGFIRRFI